MSDKNALMPAFLLPTGKGICMVHCIFVEQVNDVVILSCLCCIDKKPVEKLCVINSELWELGVQCYLDEDTNGMGWLPFIRSSYPEELKLFS